MDIYEERESAVRSYCRKFPAVFSKAKNAELYDENGKRYIDFLAVAGSMNYGHNNTEIKEAIMSYLSEDNIVNALDLHTEAKGEFLSSFYDRILKPSSLDYKIMCCGPTGTNGVEAALKLARLNTGRSNVIAFSGAFHGMSIGSLSMTTDLVSRRGAGIPLQNVTFVPYSGEFNSIEYIEWMMKDDHSGIERPAAIVLETVQAEGGINIASVEWLRKIRQICDTYGILLICDDIQVGCGRTGHFFSFERAGIVPDLVVLSKSISGFGIPMTILLIKPEYDIFKPAEHNGTFRGHQLAFVGASAATKYYVEHNVDRMVSESEELIRNYMNDEIKPIHPDIEIRGLGMLWGIDMHALDPALALKVSHRCYEKGLIAEVCGRRDGVVKIIPPLTIEQEVLIEGLDIMKESLKEILCTY
ncbi:MAG: diaminobutyrate--2-oxoglutarate transaminase [Lachnospiraceae bacterium]|nr:diaminobutyrate--2-oxoglutarate transaminase [Lachnospiraceae bacterium]